MFDKGGKKVIVLYPYKGSKTGAQMHFVDFLKEYAVSHNIQLYTTRSLIDVHKLYDVNIKRNIIGGYYLFLYRLYLVFLKNYDLPVISVNIGVRNSPKNIVLFSNALVLCRVKDIVNVYDLATTIYYTYYKLVFRLSLNQRTSHVIVQSNYMRSLMLSIGGRGYVVRKPVEDFPPRLSNRAIYKYGFIGKYYPHKGFEHFLELLQKSKTNEVGIATLSLSDLPQETVRQAKELCAANKLLLIGSITKSRINWFYSVVEIVIHLSFIESMSNTVLEAAYYSKRLLCWDNDINREYKYDGMELISDLSEWKPLDNYSKVTGSFEHADIDNIKSWEEYGKAIDKVIDSSH